MEQEIERLKKENARLKKQKITKFNKKMPRNKPLPKKPLPNKPLPTLTVGTVKVHRISTNTTVEVKPPTLPDI